MRHAACQPALLAKHRDSRPIFQNGSNCRNLYRFEALATDPFLRVVPGFTAFLRLAGCL